MSSSEGFREHDGDNNGIVMGHAYSVLGVVEIQFENESAPTKLIQVRNPWDTSSTMAHTVIQMHAGATH
jgi:hypothetical protein